MKMELETEKDLTVSQIVRNDYRTADVFKKWGINYCCGGNLPLQEACNLLQIDAGNVSDDLQRATKTIRLSNALQFNEWPVLFLLDYITHVHHEYLKRVLPALQQHISSFVSGHTKKYPYLAGVEETFSTLANELQAQTQREEESIFPYVRQIIYTFDRKETYGSLFVRTMRQPFSEVVTKEHNRISNLLLLLREQTNNYQFKPDACTNHQVIYHKLKELDADLVQHKHLENNVLFPKALEMEKYLLQI
jgi:regulator of cell morphogenesis and NO signaling